MNCPCCGNEMESGIVQSLSSHNWTRLTCKAFLSACQKVVIDYAEDNTRKYKNMVRME